MPLIPRIGPRIQAFRAAEPSPRRACAFAQAVQKRLRQVGRERVTGGYHSLEDPPWPEHIWLEGEWDRLRTRTAQRSVATRFGTSGLWRFRYQPLDSGWVGIFPWEIRLGIEAAPVTPARAERVGQ